MYFAVCILMELPRIPSARKKSLPFNFKRIGLINELSKEVTFLKAVNVSIKVYPGRIKYLEKYVEIFNTNTLFNDFGRYSICGK